VLATLTGTGTLSGSGGTQHFASSGDSSSQLPSVLVSHSSPLPSVARISEEEAGGGGGELPATAAQSTVS
jgi:hypothetical protein